MGKHGELKLHKHDDRTIDRGIASHAHLPEWTFGRDMLSTITNMERLMEETFRRPLFSMPVPIRHLLHTWDSFGDFTPSVDIRETGTEVVVKAELAGMKRDDITVKLVDGNLVISGEKKEEEKVEEGGFLRMERSYGTFHRSLALPAGIDDAHITAAFTDGILEIRIPKTAAEDATRTIPVE